MSRPVYIDNKTEIATAISGALNLPSGSEGNLISLLSSDAIAY